MDYFPELEVAESDAGLEEDGIGGEVWWGFLLGHKIKGRDCTAEVAHVELADQTVLEGLEVGVFTRVGGGDNVWWEGFRVLEEGGRRGWAGEGRERVIMALNLPQRLV